MPFIDLNSNTNSNPTSNPASNPTSPVAGNSNVVTPSPYQGLSGANTATSPVAAFGGNTSSTTATNPSNTNNTSENTAALPVAPLSSSFNSNVDSKTTMSDGVREVRGASWEDASQNLSQLQNKVSDNLANFSATSAFGSKEDSAKNSLDNVAATSLNSSGNAGASNVSQQSGNDTQAPENVSQVGQNVSRSSEIVPQQSTNVSQSLDSKPVDDSALLSNDSVDSTAEIDQKSNQVNVLDLSSTKDAGLDNIQAKAEDAPVDAKTTLDDLDLDIDEKDGGFELAELKLGTETANELQEIENKQNPDPLLEFVPAADRKNSLDVGNSVSSSNNAIANDSKVETLNANSTAVSSNTSVPAATNTSTPSFTPSAQTTPVSPAAFTNPASTTPSSSTAAVTNPMPVTPVTSANTMPVTPTPTPTFAANTAVGAPVLPKTPAPISQSNQTISAFPVNNTQLPKTESLVKPQPSSPQTESLQLQSKTYTLTDLLKQSVEKGASDLHLTADYRAMIRVDGKLVELQSQVLTHDNIMSMLEQVVADHEHVDLRHDLDMDVSYALVNPPARFRVNIFYQRNSIAAVFRLIPARIQTIEELKLPPVIKEFTALPSGLVLVTGPTGSGKTTTLAALVNSINTTEPKHIITVEDPIEYVYPKGVGLVDQRAVFIDTPDWSTALRAVLRQDPNVVLIGEMRDVETMEAALTIAETGHLVFSTLHTNSAAQTIDRIIDAFPEEKQGQLRTQLASVLMAVVSQRLIPVSGGGRRVAAEIMLVTPAIRNSIREQKVYQIDNTIQTSADLGMITMEKSLVNLVREGVISPEVAQNYANRPEEVLAHLNKN